MKALSWLATGIVLSGFLVNFAHAVPQASQKDSNYVYYRSTIDLALTTNWDEFLNAYAQ